jgi:hypothetical protein
MTRRKETPRMAPPVSEVLDKIADVADALRAGDRHAAVRVPCDGCTACCYAKRVVVNPEEEPPENLAVLALAKDRYGTRLRRRKDGSCTHLGPAGCTVYEHRPRICRLYDCRTAAICGDRFQSRGKAAPLWRFADEALP